MDDERKKRGFAWPVLIVLLLVAYPLSIGPATWLVEHGYVPESAAAVFYSPLLWMCSHLKPVYVLFEWYADLWRG